LEVICFQPGAGTLKENGGHATKGLGLHHSQWLIGLDDPSHNGLQLLG
jgi:hypothetical protein